MENSFLDIEQINYLLERLDKKIIDFSLTLPNKACCIAYLRDFLSVSEFNYLKRVKNLRTYFDNYYQNHKKEMLERAMKSYYEKSPNQAGKKFIKRKKIRDSDFNIKVENKKVVVTFD